MGGRGEIECFRVTHKLNEFFFVCPIIINCIFLFFFFLWVSALVVFLFALPLSISVDVLIEDAGKPPTQQQVESLSGAASHSSPSMELGVRSLERGGGGGGYGQQHTPNRGMMMSNSRPAVSEINGHWTRAY